MAKRRTVALNYTADDLIIKGAEGLVDQPIVMKNNTAIRGEVAPGGGWKDILNMTPNSAMEVGSSAARLFLYSSNDPSVEIGGTDYKIYTENFLPPGGVKNVRVITSSQTYTPDPSVNAVIIEGCAAGGGVPAQTAANVPRGLSGGSAGAYFKLFMNKANLTAKASIPISVGAGGPTAGGTTMLNGIISVGGGVQATGINPSNSSQPYGRSGRVNGGGINLVSSANCTVLAAIRGQRGTEGAASSATSYGGDGGSTPLGTGGYGASNLPGDAVTDAMRVPTGYGAGAGGYGMTAASGVGLDAVNGGDGVVIIWEF